MLRNWNYSDTIIMIKLVSISCDWLAWWHSKWIYCISDWFSIRFITENFEVFALPSPQRKSPEGSCTFAIFWLWFEDLKQPESEQVWSFYRLLKGVLIRSSSPVNVTVLFTFCTGCEDSSLIKNAGASDIPRSYYRTEDAVGDGIVLMES